MTIDVKKWQGRVSRAETYLNARRKERLASVRLYTGTFFGDPINNNPDISEVNFLYEFCDVMISAIYARNPYIFCRAISAKWVSFAETMETAINYYFNELNFKKKEQSCILDGILQPPGWIGCGYTYINEKSKLKREIEEEFPELKGIGKKEKVESEIGMFDETVKMDDVFMEQISSWEIMFPEGYHDIRQSPYMIRKQKITLEDLFSNPMYSDSKYRIRSGVNATRQQAPKIWNMNADVSPISGRDYDGIDLEQVSVDLFHIWDRRSMKRFTIARNFDEVLFERDWEYLSEGFPFFPLIFNEVPATDENCNAYPMSDVVPMFPQLKELSLISSSMLKHRKRAGTLLIGQQGSLSEKEAAEIQSSGDMDLVLLKNISEQALRVFSPPALPSDFYNLRNIVLEDLLRISGYTQLLGYTKDVNTATESENVRAGSVLRQSRRVDVVEEHTKQIAMYFAGLLWQFKTRKQISEIIGEEVNEEMWPDLPDDMNEARRILQKQLNFRIDAGSTQPPKDKAVERKQWENIAGVIKANFPNRIKDDAFLSQWLKKNDFKDIEKIVITNDEAEIAAAQKENKLLLQGMEQVVSPNENHMLHLQVHSQIYQTPGLQSTPQMDAHIDAHAKFMEMNSPKANPQRGDSKLSSQTTTPDSLRGGVPEFADILGASKPREMGVNTGGV